MQADRGPSGCTSERVVDDTATKTPQGKSFLLTSIYLWCLVHRRNCKACAPTGQEGTEREASPLHVKLHIRRSFVLSLPKALPQPTSRSRAPTFPLRPYMPSSIWTRKITLRGLTSRRGPRRCRRSWRLTCYFWTRRYCNGSPIRP